MFKSFAFAVVTALSLLLSGCVVSSDEKRDEFAFDSTVRIGSQLFTPSNAANLNTEIATTLLQPSQLNEGALIRSFRLTDNRWTEPELLEVRITYPASSAIDGTYELTSAQPSDAQHHAKGSYARGASDIMVFTQGTVKVEDLGQGRYRLTFEGAVLERGFATKTVSGYVDGQFKEI